MAKQFLTSVDLTGNQLLNAVAQFLASGSGVTTEGKFYYNSTGKALEYHNGTAIQTLATLADIAGAGGGDMLKSVYDTNDDGKVNSAVNADVAPWSGLTGVPSTFTPSAHTHTASEVTDFVTAVNTQIAAYWDTLADTDASVDTIRELLDLVLANQGALTSLVKRFQATIGDGAATTYAVTHSMNTRDVVVQIYDSATYEEIIADVTRNTVNQVTIDFATAPASGAYRVVVMA